MDIKLPLYMSTSYLDKQELYQMSQVIPECQAVLEHVWKKQCAFRQWKNNLIPLGWSRAHLALLYNRFPTLPFLDRFCGGTNYLDGISADDVECGIMKGTDSYGRIFITIRYKCLDKEFRFDGEVHSLDPNREVCLTLFQRYTDANMWCKAGIDSSNWQAPLLYGCSTYLDDKLLDLLVSNLFRMLSGLPIVYYDYQDKSEQTPSIKRYLRCQLV